LRPSPRLANLLLLGCSSFAAALAAELLLRLAYPQPLDAAYVWPDGTLRHLPSFRYTYTRAGFANEVGYNALGLRGPDPAPAKVAGTLRLAVLGDSFVEGKQVGDAEVFTAQLERLAAADGQRLEVLNAGMGGYGTSDELLLWERVVAALRPDLVLVAFFPNDVRNNLERAWFDVREGRVVQVAEPPRPRVRWLYKAQKFLVSRSHLAYLVKSAALTLSGAAPDRREEVPDAPRGKLLEDEEVFLVEPSPRIARGWTLTFALLRELALRVEASGARFAVVLVPNRYQVDAALWRLHARQLGLDPAAFGPELPQRRFAEWSRETGIPVIDLLPELRERNRDNSFYHLLDAHWNAAGHRVAAEALLRELGARGLLRPDDGSGPRRAGEAR
jgi:lysophospholipase L1-like esterase